jgi:hypothetical protein
MRLVKSPMELRLLQHAIDISTEAHQRAWAAAGEAKWEYEVDAVMAYTSSSQCRQLGLSGYRRLWSKRDDASLLESQGPVKQGDCC